MDTLTHRSQPYSWPCQNCGQPIDFWDGGPWPDGPHPFDPMFCARCCAQRLPPEEQAAALGVVQGMNRDVRRHVGLQSGTLITWRDDIPNQRQPSSEPLPGIGFAVVIDAWNPAWPQMQYPWVDGHSRIVVLASYVSAEANIAAGELTYWSWLYPDAEARSATIPPEFVPTEKERSRFLDARGAFITLKDRRGRPRGSGARFETRDDFIEAVRNAIHALCKGPPRISKAAIGRYIGRTYAKSRPDDDRVLADPGTQMGRWEDEFEIDIDVLIRELCPYEVTGRH